MKALYHVFSCGLSHLYKNKIMDIQKESRGQEMLYRGFIMKSWHGVSGDR